MALSDTLSDQALSDLMADQSPFSYPMTPAPAGVTALGLSLSIPGLPTLFASAMASITQGNMTLSGLACVCTPDADGLTTDVVIAIPSSQSVMLMAGAVSGIIYPLGAAVGGGNALSVPDQSPDIGPDQGGSAFAGASLAPIPFSGTLLGTGTLLLTASFDGTFCLRQGDTRRSVAFYLPFELLPGLIGATLAVVPLVSGAPFYIDAPATLNARALALDGLAQSPPYVRLDFPAGWGEPNLPAGDWLAWAVLSYQIDGLHPNGQALTVPLTPDNSRSLDGVTTPTALLRVLNSSGY